jgi:hypothetical protein
LTAELPELGESLTWSQLEAWAVAMREELPAAALATALEDLQDRLIDRVCGPKWLPVRDLPAPFGCPGCGVMSDFARKGKRTRPRRFDTAAGIVRIQLANVGCRSCGRVFAPLLLMLDLSGKRRTDRLMAELAELASQMSFARAGRWRPPSGCPAPAGGRMPRSLIWRRCSTASAAPILRSLPAARPWSSSTAPVCEPAVAGWAWTATSPWASPPAPARAAAGRSTRRCSG